jgi:hypothetical protein
MPRLTDLFSGNVVRLRGCGRPILRFNALVNLPVILGAFIQRSFPMFAEDWAYRWTITILFRMQKLAPKSLSKQFSRGE